MSSSGARESRWLELATLRALMASARDAAAVPAVAAGRELLRRRQQPGRRGGGGDHAAAAGGNDKRAKVMHLLLWGPK
jgi:hypothetical protein